MNTQPNFIKVPNKQGQFNLIPTPSSFLCDTWYDYIGEFSEGLACVLLNGKCTYINTNGKQQFNIWFTVANPFNNGWGCVRDSDGKFNFINHNGEFLSKESFDYASSFVDGFARVCINEMWNLINTTGEYLLDEWLDGESDSMLDGFYYGCALIKKDGKYNYINKEGNLLLDTWCDVAKRFDNDYTFIKYGDTKCVINNKGNILKDVSR